MFNSIRWNLLFWYTVILLATVVGLSAVLYANLSRSLLRGADAELRAHALALAGALEMEKGKWDLELSEEHTRYFNEGGRSAPYYLVWDSEGKVLFRSRPEIDVPRTAAQAPHTRNRYRESSVPGVLGSTILVGRSVHRELENLREFTAFLVGASAGMIGLALLGGWFLAGRALRPIARITEAASAISASNLSQRIDVRQTESELGRLARTLNDAFDRLASAFERQTRFTADASHELRTPLSIALSQAELALKKDRSPAEYREALKTVLRASERMKAVVEGLLTLARADAQELPLRKERLDLRELVEETAVLLAPLAIERKVALSVSSESVDVSGDRDRLREAVINLITNAVHYNREGGKVDLTVHVERNSAVLSVADTGIGIPERDQQHIFERFFRVDKARSREAGGNGLGLAITKSIVEAHGGAISFESREDLGTTFTVRLPRA